MGGRRDLRNRWVSGGGGQHRRIAGARPGGVPESSSTVGVVGPYLGTNRVRFRGKLQQLRGRRATASDDGCGVQRRPRERGLVRAQPRPRVQPTYGRRA